MISMRFIKSKEMKISVLPEQQKIYLQEKK
jgi:hypothetical protein